MPEDLLNVTTLIIVHTLDHIIVHWLKIQLEEVFSPVKSEIMTKALRYNNNFNTHLAGCDV